MQGAYHDQENYRWMVPRGHIKEVARKYEDIIAWHTSLDNITGEQKAILPDFTVTDEGLDDMKIKPYPFQVIGISFLHDIEKGIIGDEMGLGKTCITMGAAHRLWREGKANKVLVICPASLKFQWKEEIEKFTDHKAIVIDGTAKKKRQQLAEFKEGDEYLFAVANYEVVRTMVDDFTKLKIDVAICDEAHRLKNRASQTFKALMKIQPPYRFASTGTPMQNRLEELHTLMCWVNKDILPGITNFRKRHIVYGEKFGRKYVPLGYKRQYEVRNKVSEVMLRRLKSEVAPELPEMTFHRYDIAMTPDQAKLYDKIKEDFSIFLQEIGEFAKQAKGEMKNGEWVQEKHPKEDMILGYMAMLLAVADDPQLLRMSKGGMAKQYLPLVPKESVSPKLKELTEICSEQIESGNQKIVIFTQFTRMQERVINTLSKLGKCEMINGSMKPFERQQAVNNFKWKSDVNFLVCTDAANAGLNLQFANVLIHVDSPYNPAIIEQRNGRVHRIGGEHDMVNIISLVSQDTIDERIQLILEEKRNLSKQVVERNDSEKMVMKQLLAAI